MPLNSIQNQWDEYYPKVYGYFFRRVTSKSDVEDLTSLTMEGFLKVSQKPLENPHAYLWKIAHNQLARYINHKSKQPVIITLDENLNTGIDLSLENFRTEHFQTKIQNLMRCVEKNLNGIDLKIVQSVVMFDKKCPEVAQELNLNHDNVRQKLSRGLKKLKAKCIDIWNIS
jgi:RNA polymerase sigma factor (sigma-70 family)